MAVKNKLNVRILWQDYFPSQAKKFLDIGCGSGQQTCHLVEAGKEVVGVEIDPEKAAEAAKRLTKVYAGDAGAAEIDYPEEYFDCVIYGGVIGAFRDGEAVLRRHGRYLKDGGYVVAHAPNVRYYKVIIMLMFKGVWDVMPHGILYYPYIRHYTLTNYRELFLSAGFEIVDVKRILRGSRWIRGINKLMFGCFDEFLTYEYFIKAKRIKNAHSSGDVLKRKKVVF